jgi:hypothetical protein
VWSLHCYRPDEVGGCVCAFFLTCQLATESSNLNLYLSEFVIPFGQLN